jgi:hypothetical protein
MLTSVSVVSSAAVAVGVSSETWEEIQQCKKYKGKGAHQFLIVPPEHPNVDLLPDIRDSHLGEEGALDVRCMQFLGPVELSRLVIQGVKT